MTKSIHLLDEEELKLLEKSIGPERDKLLLKILYETGCTVNEAVRIRIDDLDLFGGKINFPAENTKSKKAKTSIISRELAETIKEYLEKKQQEEKKRSDEKPKGQPSNYLFSTRQSGRMTTKRVRQLLQKHGQKAGIGKVLPQMIRYAHIIHAINKGLPLEAIAKQTGLDKIRIIQIYDATSQEEPQEQYIKLFKGDTDKERTLKEYLEKKDE